MIRPKPMFWILLGGMAMWYFLIMYPITTILTILGSTVTAALIIKYSERNFWNE
jgi:hypothetical protein